MVQNLEKNWNTIWKMILWFEDIWDGHLGKMASSNIRRNHCLQKIDYRIENCMKSVK